MKTFDSSEMLLYINNGFTFTFSQGIVTVINRDSYPRIIYSGDNVEHAFSACSFLFSLGEYQSNEAA